MPAAPPHPDEIRRVAAVRRLRLFGTPSEERFDKITRLARRMFGVPVSVIDIIGDKMVWLKSANGVATDLVDYPKEGANCAYAILENKICLIQDARQDPRVSDFPSSSEHIFYAGVPLQYDGQNIGVFCITDTSPRTLTTDEIEALCDLAALAETELAAMGLSESQIALSASNVELEAKANIDVLTRVWNRGAIMEIAARELISGPFAVGILDIDFFKNVNDAHGHRAGDEVLRMISERLRRSVRPTDAIGRYGGEEFLLVFPGCGRESMFAAERVREAVCAEPVEFEGKRIQITVSVGVTCSEGAHDVDSMVKEADCALYRAKKEGRDCVRSQWSK